MLKSLFKKFRKQPIKPKSKQDSMNYMASIGMSPDSIMRYEQLCNDIEAQTASKERVSE